jgi:phage terminase large subunit GpA-like protein
MAVRNFYATIQTEGRQAATGPARKESDMTVRVDYRDRGGVSSAPVEVWCHTGADGVLRIVVTHGGQTVFETTSTR